MQTMAYLLLFKYLTALLFLQTLSTNERSKSTLHIQYLFYKLVVNAEISLLTTCNTNLKRCKFDNLYILLSSEPQLQHKYTHNIRMTSIEHGKVGPGLKKIENCCANT